MEMWTGAPTGIAHGTDYLSARNRLAIAHREGVHVRVQRLKTAGMAQNDKFAVVAHLRFNMYHPTLREWAFRRRWPNQYRCGIVAHR